MYDLDTIRDTLSQAMEQQQAADEQALATQQLLGKQKLMYGNEARGTLYSGQPTWERAQLGAEGITKLADIQGKYLDKRVDIWGNIADVMDKINSYNKAAAALNKASSNVSSSTSSGQSYLEYYNSLQGGE